MYLFFDSSEFLCVGLLDENFEWLDYKKLVTKKNSEVFHGTVFEMLNKHQLEITQMKGILQVAGPGSYTGMRLSEGMCQVLEWHKIPIFSFTHFKVPEILGVEKGAWISEAFKGEIFVYFWNQKKSGTELMKKADRDEAQILQKISDYYGPVYTHYDSGVYDCLFTGDLIRHRAPEIFSYVIEHKLREPPFYYRELEDEFRPSLK